MSTGNMRANSNNIEILIGWKLTKVSFVFVHVGTALCANDEYAVLPFAPSMTDRQVSIAGDAITETYRTHFRISYSISTQ